MQADAHLTNSETTGATQHWLHKLNIAGAGVSERAVSVVGIRLGIIKKMLAHLSILRITGVDLYKEL